MNNQPHPVTRKILEDLDKLVAARQEETVRSLQSDIEAAINKVMDDFKAQCAASNQTVARNGT